MKLVELRAGGPVGSLSLRNDVGLAGFISRGTPHWGSFMTSLHEAYRSAGHFVGPGPSVDSGEGPLTVGSRAFETALAAHLTAHGLSREAYAAIWFGDGPIASWLQAGRTLFHGPDVTLALNAAPSPTSAAGGSDSALHWVERLRAEAAADLERLGAAGPGVDELEARLLSLRADATEAGGDLEVGLMSWVRERQDAETRLLLYRDREQELRRRVEELETADGDPTCETCGQPLGEQREAVLEARSEEWEAVVQDGRWWRRRRDQLEFKPDDLKDIESRLRELEAQMEETSEALERSRVQLRELEMVRVRAQHLEALADLVEEEVGGLGHGPSPAESAEVDQQLASIRGRLDAAAERQLRARIHARVVALTDGRLIGSFPALYADWSTGGRRGGGEVSILELAARITLAELALTSGVALGSLVLPTGLDRINEEDLPRALEELGRLARKVGMVLTKATEDVASAAPERFDLLFRVDHAKGSPRILRQRSGLGVVYLKGARGVA